MKLLQQIIFISCLLSAPLMAQQSEEQFNTYSAGLRMVHLYDIGAYKFDTELSRDLKGLNGEFTSFDLGVDVYGEKQITPLLGIQGGFRFGSMTGSNDVEHYKNRFHQFYTDLVFNLSNMDRRRMDAKYNYFAKAGLGRGIYSAERFLNSDGSLNGDIRSAYWEGRIGAGVQYEFNSFIRFEVDASYNVVYDDGFDGYNHASGRDPYFSVGIGAAYTFGSRDKKPLYSVNFFTPEYFESAGTAASGAAASRENTAERSAPAKKKNSKSRLNF